MAVIAVWQCDRDNSMFQNKKDAEEYDKMLELAENIATLIEENVEGVSGAQGEAIGLLLAKHREVLAKACKGKPELLLEDLSASETGDEERADSAAAHGNVTPLAAKV